MVLKLTFIVIFAACGLALVGYSAAADNGSGESGTPAEAVSTPSEGEILAQHFGDTLVECDSKALTVKLSSIQKELGNPLLFQFSRHQEGRVSAVLRRTRDGVRFRPATGDVVWAELNAQCVKVSAKLSYEGGGTASLRFRSVEGENDFFIRATATEVRISRPGNRREKIVSRAKLERAITGQISLTAKFSATRISASIGSGNNTAEVSTEDNLPASVTVSFGAQDGRLKMTRLGFDLTLDQQWWRSQRPRSLAGAHLRRLRERGAGRLFESVQHNPNPKFVEAQLKNYSQEQLDKRQQGQLIALAGELPDNALARFEAAGYLRDGGRFREALSYLDAGPCDEPAYRELGAELALRLGVAAAAREWLKDSAPGPNRDLLDGLIRGALGDYKLSAQALAKSPHPLAADLTRSANLLATGAGLTETQVVEGIELRTDRDGADAESVAGMISAATAQYTGLVGPLADKKVEVWVFSEAKSFTESVLLHAHRRIDGVGALYVQGSPQTPARVFLCSAVGAEALERNLRHELWHVYFAAGCPEDAVRVWVNEGLAVLFSASASGDKDGKTMFFLPVEVQGTEENLISILRGTDARARLRSLFQASPDQFYASGSSDENYALAWAVVWYTVTSADNLKSGLQAVARVAALDSDADGELRSLAGNTANALDSAFGEDEGK